MRFWDAQKNPPLHCRQKNLGAERGAAAKSGWRKKTKKLSEAA